MVHRKVYRERHRAILKILVEQYGPYEAYDMYGWGLRNPIKYKVCHSEIQSYSEWRETVYEHERCSNGCWDHATYGLHHELETDGFSYSGKLDWNVMAEFKKQIERNAIKAKQRRLLFHRKKKSQRCKSMNL